MFDLILFLLYISVAWLVRSGNVFIITGVFKRQQRDIKQLNAIEWDGQQDMVRHCDDRLFQGRSIIWFYVIIEGFTSFLTFLVVLSLKRANLKNNWFDIGIPKKNTKKLSF